MIFDLRSVQDRTGINITGAIHVGAFLGEELPQYRHLGLTNTILFEPQKHLYEMVKARCLPTEQVFHTALGSEESIVDMFVSDREGGVRNGAGASSSILEPRKHLTEHPEVTFPTKETITVHRFDKFVKDNNINIVGFNFLNIDVQGYELEVLKGIGNTLNQIQMMIVEVNRDEVYTGCPMVEELDEFLQQYDIFRSATAWQSQSWGDALYVRN